MHFIKVQSHRLFALLPFWLATSLATAQTRSAEIPGGKDHPLISRYAGSLLVNASHEGFASLRIPSGPGRYSNDGKPVFDKAASFEGRLSGYVYSQPQGRTALEVFRNYQAALRQAGFITLHACELQACEQGLIDEQFVAEAVRPRKWDSRSMDPTSALGRTKTRFVSAKLSRNGTDTYVIVYVAEPNSSWPAATAVVLVAEPAPMEAGKVVIDSDKLQRSLADDGKIALYGLYFDTGKAEIKPESKPQLQEMARLLQASKSLKVWIVGHTDNQGPAETNIALSQRRAEAVVAVLVNDHRIDVTRLKARGVASLAPVTTNANEAGRSRNRRVELVEQ